MDLPALESRYDGAIPAHCHTRAAPAARCGPPPALYVDFNELLTRARLYRATGASLPDINRLYPAIAALHARLVRLKSWDVL